MAKITKPDTDDQSNADLPEKPSTTPAPPMIDKPATPEPVVEEEKPILPPPLSPPPKASPTGVMKALVRLAELEASMEYAYAKHMLLVKRRAELRAQHKVLEMLPVGIEAIQEDLEMPRPADGLYDD
jgi:hypothetical protein